MVDYIALAVAAAGIGFIITLFVNALNDILLAKRLSVVHPDTMISIDFLGATNPVQAVKEGLYSIFFAGWVSVYIFLLLWLTPFFQAYTGGNVWVAAFVYAFGIYLFMMLILMPLAKRGAFGVLYHPKTPYWSFALLLLYAVLLAILVPVVV